MLKGLIFDLDGTITLTEPLHYKAYATIFRDYGIKFSYKDEIEKYAGSGSRNIFTSVFAVEGKPVDSAEIEKCMEKKKELYNKIIQDSYIMAVDGVKEFLKKTDKMGFKKIIATGNSNLDVVNVILNKIDVAEYFLDIVPISAVPRGKPFPDIFLEAARRLNFQPSECVVFEDAINGVKAAVDAGIRCIALETSTKREDLLKAGASIVVKNYNEITNEILYGN